MGSPFWSGKVNSGALELTFMARHSPCRFKLYRSPLCLVILALLLAKIGPAQVTRREKTSPGPRAIGLLQIPPKGKAHLIPIAILVDGQFFDASAYKAAPVPFALYSDTVGEGTWRTEDEVAAAAAKKKKVSSIPRGMGDDDGRPHLKRAPGSESTTSDSSASKTTATPAPAAPPPGPTSTSAGTTPAPMPAPAPAPTASTTAANPNVDPDDADPNRPALKRGKQDSKPEIITPTPVSVSLSKPKPGATSATDKSALSAAAQIQVFPAISDAHTVESHTYEFIAKQDELDLFRKKMLDLAKIEVQAKLKPSPAQSTNVPEPAPRKVTTKTSATHSNIDFKNVQLRVFDLNSSNEPVLILTTIAAAPGTSKSPTQTLYLTLVAREDLYGDLHKAFSNITDDAHLDVIPRLELIDAVDADGDGQGELLFQQHYAAGSTYLIDRVMGQQLYPLFEGKLAQP